MITIEEYLDFKRSERTRYTVRSALKLYFVYVAGEEPADLDEYVKSYFTSDRDYFRDVVGFRDSLISSGYAPKTLNFRINYVLHFLEWNGVQFTPLQSSMIRVKLPRNVAIRDDDTYDIQKIQSILAHSDVFLRALVLVLVSSGMRISEALSFTEAQIHENEIHMQAGQMKAAKPHIYFISSEALAALAEWRKVRDEAVRQANKKTYCLGIPLKHSDAVFPCSYNTARMKFQNVMRKAGLYEKDISVNQARLTFHGFRKFADSTMKAHITPNLANALIGHFEAGDSSYRRYTLEQLRAAYAEVEPYLTISATSPELSKGMQEVKETLATHDRLLLEVVGENYELKKRMGALERILKADNSF